MAMEKRSGYEEKQRSCVEEQGLREHRQNPEQCPFQTNPEEKDISIYDTKGGNTQKTWLKEKQKEKKSNLGRVV